MHIDKYIDPEGGYIMDGANYDNAGSLILNGMFQFCGCGTPEEAGRLILQSLKLIRDCNAEKITWKERDKQYPSEAWRYFMAYQLDNWGLTEHGTSVDSAWLTDKGIEVMEDLEQILA